MKTRFSTSNLSSLRQIGAIRRNSVSSLGLTLLEMMVAVTLLLVIVGGLTMMFLQTQKAFRGGLHQVDVFEGGRSAMEMITRDIEQLTSSGDISNVNFRAITSCDYTTFNPTVIPGTPFNVDTNYCENFFILTHGADWQGISYKVLDTNKPSMSDWQKVVVGSLYRHTTNSVNIRGDYLYTNFNKATWDQYHRVLDGVVRFQVRVFDPTGIEIFPTKFTPHYEFVAPDIRVGVDRAELPFEYEFSNNALPGYIEIELAILEPQAVELMKVWNPVDGIYTQAIYDKQRQFVQDNASKIHTFRQQIPIRSVTR